MAALRSTVADAGGHPGAMTRFLGVEPDPGLLTGDGLNLPAAEQRRPPPPSVADHHRLVAAGAIMTGTTLIVGVLLVLYGVWRLLTGGLTVSAGLVAGLGLVLAGTHWGWVHVAEYVRLSIDDHHQSAADAVDREWLAGVAPYPRLSVVTTVLENASISVQRVRHQPVLTDHGTFTFVREVDEEKLYPADTPAELIAAAVETERRRGRLATDRLRSLWETASSVYDSRLLNAGDAQERLAAERAAAQALSEHLNQSLRQAPLEE